MKIHKNTYGFTLIETLIGILMTTIICSTLFLGVTQAKLYLESIRIKEKAFLELKNFPESHNIFLPKGEHVSLSAPRLVVTTSHPAAKDSIAAIQLVSGQMLG